MENISKKASDSIELCAIIYDIYKKAKEAGMYIIDRRKNNAFGVVLKDMSVSYDALAIPFERFYDNASLKKKQWKWEFFFKNMTKNIFFISGN